MTSLNPDPAIRDVEVNPLRRFGEPSTRGVPTEVIRELYAAGDPIEMIAELYSLQGISSRRPCTTSSGRPTPTRREPASLAKGPPRMVAVEHLVRFYVDESATGLGPAMAAPEVTPHVGHPLIPECPRGALDTEWIPAVAARGLIVITRDKKLRTKPVEIARSGNTGYGCSASAARKTSRRGSGSPE